MALTNSQPCHSRTGTSTSPYPSGSKSGTPRIALAVASDPSSRYAHPWYGHTMLPLVAVPPSGRSSCPRCRHTFANARTPSPASVTSTPTSPAVTDHWLTPGSGRRPTQVHAPANRCRRSQASTAGEVYAVAGSVRELPNGRNAWATSSSASGAAIPVSMSLG